MRHARAFGIAIPAALVVAGAVAFAQSTPVPLPEQAPIEAAPLDESAVADLADAEWGDAERGATLASTCAACHGLDGRGTDRSIYPSIAGQNERYIAHQLALFKTGQRVNAIMQPYAEPLSAQDMRDLGAHYAQQEAGAGIADDTVVESGPYEGMRFFEIGQQLFRGGDPERDIPACMACHDPAGTGNPGPPYPHVGGQTAWYTARRLQEFRSGTTNESDTRLFEIMHAVAEPLTDEEIQALASYMEGLHPRPNAAVRAAMAQVEPDEVPLPATPAPAIDGADDTGTEDAGPEPESASDEAGITETEPTPPKAERPTRQ